MGQTTLQPEYTAASVYDSKQLPYYTGIAAIGSNIFFPPGHVLTVTWAEGADLSNTFIDYSDMGRTNIELLSIMDSINWQGTLPVFIVLSNWIYEPARLSVFAANTSRVKSVELAFKSSHPSAGTSPASYTIQNNPDWVRAAAFRPTDVTRRISSHADLISSTSPNLRISRQPRRISLHGDDISVISCALR